MGFKGKFQGKKHRVAMAARGYWRASKAVKNSIEIILEGANSGIWDEKDHSD